MGGNEELFQRGRFKLRHRRVHSPRCPSITEPARRLSRTTATLKIMPRYFFNTRIGDDTIPDVEGEELRDADHAWEVAKAMIVDLLEDEGNHPNLLTAALLGLLAR